MFLRNLRATLIPSAVVPISLLGTFAIMYVVGFSLDNLSLMALTIAVGFVVDDAIVVVENIYRHIEAGEKPYQAALRGAGEIGFTVVLDQPFARGRVHPAFAHGRHHRAADARVRADRHGYDCGFGHRVADADADAVLALSRAGGTESRMAQPADRRFFDALVAGYERTLSIALRHRFITLMVFFVTLGLTVFLLHLHAEGLFPGSGYRHLFARDGCPAGYRLSGDV